MSKEELRAAFGAAVKRAREDRGWSLRELARRCGVQPNAVSQWESGRGAKESSVHAIEDALGLPRGHLGWMLGYSHPPASATVEVALEADPQIPASHKRALRAYLAEVRRLGIEPDDTEQ